MDQDGKHGDCSLLRRESSTPSEASVSSRKAGGRKDTESQQHHVSNAWTLTSSIEGSQLPVKLRRHTSIQTKTNQKKCVNVQVDERQ